MRLNHRVHCLVVFLLCIAVAGVAPTVPSPAQACESATSLVHISDVATHRHYKTGWAEIGARVYVDRPYKISQITQGLAGGVLVRTANNDKWFKKKHLFTLTVDQDAWVYVCFDQRAVKRLPDWLASWTLIPEESIVTTDWSASPMAVYGKTVGGGKSITLGGNHAGGYSGAKSNFFAVVKFKKPGSRLMEILSVSSKRSYRLAEAKRGALQYMDRKYRIIAMSPELEGGVLVRTANDDKRNNREHHLRLYMHNQATLFVAYDKRGASKPPQWLSDWNATDLTIRTSDRRASPMVVFQRSVDKDEIVELGGNRYKGGYKAWSNYFVVAVPDEPWKRNALLVVGKSRLNFSDALVKSRLEARGFRVTVKDDDEVITADADGKDIVLLSESVYSKRVGDIFTQVPVPVICWEPYLYDDLGMTGNAAGIDFGYVRKQREIDVVDPEHPMAGKKQGTIPVTKYPARFGWGLPDASAQVVATLVDDPGKAALFYYDAETDMPGGFPAPARRIGLFFDKHTPKKLNADGRRLLEAAFDTALGVNSLKILSDDSWKSTDQEYVDWETPGFDDSGWNDAVSPYPNRKPAHHWFRMPGTNAQYMWDFPPGSGEMNGRNGPEEVWFRKTFDLPVQPCAVTRATVTMAVDDVFDLYVNGKPVFSNWDNAGHSGPVTLNILEYLKEGSNLLAIYASDAYRGYEWALFEATIEWEPVVTSERDWTVMVYLNGDNENEAAMLGDLEEIETGLAGAVANDPQVMDKLAVVALYDGNGPGGTIRYEFRNEDGCGTGGYIKIADELPEANMGDPARLKEFLDYSKKHVPAKNYALILSNHGTAAASPASFGYTSSPAKYILWDETDENGAGAVDRLYVGEVTNAPEPNGLTESESVDVIGLDTGFMGTLETAYQFRPEPERFGANYMVASPAEALDTGWNYESILINLGDVAELTAKQFAETIVDNSYKDPDTGATPITDNYALAAYALLPDEGETMPKVTVVKNALDKLASAIGQNSNAWNFAKGARGYASRLTGSPLYNASPVLEYFDDQEISRMPSIPGILTPPSNWLQTPLFDLYSFSTAFSAPGPIPQNVRNAAGDLTTAVDACVMASYGNVTREFYYNGRSGPPWTPTTSTLSNGLHGLAFVFPDGEPKIQGRSSYRYLWWYTWEDTTDLSKWPSAPPTNYASDTLYGQLDFCKPVAEGNGKPDSWRELLEWWFDRMPPSTPGGF